MEFTYKNLTRGRNYPRNIALHETGTINAALLTAFEVELAWKEHSEPGETERRRGRGREGESHEEVETGAWESSVRRGQVWLIITWQLSAMKHAGYRCKISLVKFKDSISDSFTLCQETHEFRIAYSDVFSGMLWRKEVVSYSHISHIQLSLYQES